MARRTYAWALVTPLAAAGVLAAHALAYGVTGSEAGTLHDYLDHAPQVAGVLVVLGLLGLALQGRAAGRPSLTPFGLLAVTGFVAQEHLERLAHTGEVPWLLTDPAFLVGLVLVMPVALGCLALARRIVGALAAGARRRSVGGRDVFLPLSVSPVDVPRGRRPGRATGRGPPTVRMP